MKTTSRKRAAEILSVSIKTIDRMLRDGRIRGFKAYGSSRVLIYEDSITESNLQSAKAVFQNDL